MPNDVGCPICGKRYFPHSLKIHLPQCQRKWASVEVPCPRCDKPVLQGELEEHLEKCRAPRKAALHRRSWNGDTANAARALSLPISRARPPRERASWSGPAQHDSPRQAAAAAFRTQFKPTAPRPASRTKRWEPPAETTAFSTAAAPGGLLPCAVCGRKFSADRLGVHQNICRKAHNNRRPVFDGASMRQRAMAEENGLAAPPRRRPGRRRPPSADARPPAPPKKNWRAESNAFRAMVRDARRMTVAEKAGVPLRDIQPSRAAQDAYDLETSDFRQCPHCGRTFNPKAWERHVPHCAKTRNRPKPPPGRRAFGRGAARRTGSMNF